MGQGSQQTSLQVTVQTQTLLTLKEVRRQRRALSGKGHHVTLGKEVAESIKLNVLKIREVKHSLRAVHS